MDIHINWSATGVIIALCAHAGFTIWYAATFKATISSKLDSLVTALARVDTELEKRDEKISAAFKKIDNINGRLYKIEAKE